MLTDLMQIPEGNSGQIRVYGSRAHKVQQAAGQRLAGTFDGHLPGRILAIFQARAKCPCGNHPSRARNAENRPKCLTASNSAQELARYVLVRPSECYDFIKS
jgi:hypothetical protein